MVTKRGDLRAFNTFNRNPDSETLKWSELELRKNAYRAIGCSEEWINTLQRKKPALYTIDTIEGHLHGFQDRGFANPQKIIREFPMIQGVTFEYIDDRLLKLKEFGFTNPRKLVESEPIILGLSLQNIDSKLRGLKERGFDNPVKMVESSAAILGYSFRNIDRRLKLLNRLTKLYNLTFTAQELMEKQNAFFTTSIDKLFILTRVLRKVAKNPKEITRSSISRFVFENLENVLIVVDTIKESERVTLHQLLQRAKDVRMSDLPKAQKRERIISGLKNDPKIKRRYLRRSRSEQNQGPARG
jgi:hypothetical protein